MRTLWAGSILIFVCSRCKKEVNGAPECLLCYGENGFKERDFGNMMATQYALDLLDSEKNLFEVKYLLKKRLDAINKIEMW